MKLTSFTTIIVTLPTVFSKSSVFTWDTSNDTNVQIPAGKVNYSYEDFVGKARKRAEKIKSFLELKEIPCEDHILIGPKKSSGCYQIEIEAPERDHTQLKNGEIVKVGHVNEISLFNLLSYSLNDERKTMDYWMQGIDKAKLIMDIKLECEKVTLPMENLGMTMATEGSVSFSQFDETSINKSWKVGGILEVETPPLNPLGKVSVTMTGYYQDGHTKSLRSVKDTSYSALPNSPCTPSLMKTALLCPAINAWSVISMNNTVMDYKLVNIPSQFIMNINGNLFDSTTACIDYTRG